MSEYYVSNVRGSDSGTGTATDPFATINKVIGPSGVATAGDRGIVEPGIYRETVAVGVSGSSGSPITLVGDGDGSLFSAGGYSTPSKGTVEIAAWTDDVTPFTTTAVILSLSNKSYLDFSGLKLVGGAGTNGYSCFEVVSSSSNVSFTDCLFLGSSYRGICGRLDATASTALNVSIRRCDFYSISNAATFYGVDVRSPVNATEYSLGLLFDSCQFFGSAGGIKFTQAGGTGSSWATGATIQSCSFWFTYRGVWVSSATALTTPIAVYGCSFAYGNSALVATTAGQIVEDGNAYISPSALTNVTAGTHSITSYRPGLSFHDERLSGGNPRPFGEPTEGSVILGAGNYGTPPLVDIWGQDRPASPSIGALERDEFETPTIVNNYIFSGEF